MLKIKKEFAPVLSFFLVLFLILFLFVPKFSQALLAYHDYIKGLLTSSYTINGWILLFFIIFSSIGFMFVLYRIYYIKPSAAFFTSYKQDTIKNAVWKWQWVNNDIEHLWCYCPVCNSELSYESDHLLFQTKFTCTTCNQEIMKMEGSHINYVLNYIKREVRRNIQRKIKEGNETKLS